MDAENHYSLTPAQLEQLKELLSAKDKQKLDEILAESKETGTDPSPKEKIKARVFNTLSELSGKDQSEIQEPQDLYRDLGLSEYHKKSLKRPFQKIIEDFGSSKNILVKECMALITVNDSLELVTSKL